MINTFCLVLMISAFPARAATFDAEVKPEIRTFDVKALPLLVISEVSREVTPDILAPIVNRWRPLRAQRASRGTYDGKVSRLLRSQISQFDFNEALIYRPHLEQIATANRAQAFNWNDNTLMTSARAQATIFSRRPYILKTNASSNVSLSSQVVDEVVFKLRYQVETATRTEHLDGELLRLSSRFVRYVDGENPGDINWRLTDSQRATLLSNLRQVPPFKGLSNGTFNSLDLQKLRPYIILEFYEVHGGLMNVRSEMPKEFLHAATNALITGATQFDVMPNSIIARYCVNYLHGILGILPGSN